MSRHEYFQNEGVGRTTGRGIHRGPRDRGEIWWELSINAPEDATEKRITVDSDQVSVSAEVFGDDAKLFFQCGNKSVAQEVARVLRRVGGDPDFGWCSGSEDRFQMEVSYFKGARWWE